MTVNFGKGVFLGLDLNSLRKYYFSLFFILSSIKVSEKLINKMSSKKQE